MKIRSSSIFSTESFPATLQDLQRQVLDSLRDLGAVKRLSSEVPLNSGMIRIP